MLGVVVVLMALLGVEALDECPVLVCNEGAEAGTTVGAPNQIGDVAGDAVFSFSLANDTDKVVLDTCDSDFDTVLYVLDAGTLAQVAFCDDCGVCDTKAQLSIDNMPAGDYLVVLGGRNDLEGNFSISLACESLNATATAAMTAGVNGSAACVLAPTPTPVDPTRCSPSTQREILDRLTGEGSGYDSLTRPGVVVNAGLPNEQVLPTNVSTQFFLTGIDDVALVGGDLLTYAYMLTMWTDPRLKFNGTANGGCFDELHVGSSEWHRFWRPDTYVENLVEGVVVMADGLYIAPDGFMWMDLKVAIRTTCQFALQSFPLDSQECAIEVSSYTHSRNEIWLDFHDDTAIEVAPDFYNSEYELFLDGNTPSSVDTWYFEGVNPWHFSFHRFVLKRKPAFYYKYIGASVMGVLISYMSFFINRDAAPARVTSALLPILFNITLLMGLQASLPKLTYWTWLEKFLFGTLMFCGVTAIEYSVVSFLLVKEAAVKAAEARRQAKLEQDAYLATMADLIAKAIAKSKKKDRAKKGKEEDPKSGGASGDRNGPSNVGAGGDDDDKGTNKRKGPFVVAPLTARATAAAPWTMLRDLVRSHYLSRLPSMRLDLICREFYILAYFLFVVTLASQGLDYNDSDKR